MIVMFYSKEYWREYMRAWKKSNSEKVNIINQKYRRKLREAIFNKYGRFCQSCGAKEKELELDHIYNDAFNKTADLSRHGRLGIIAEWQDALRDTTGRFQILCKKCNLAKEIKSE